MNRFTIFFLLVIFLNTHSLPQSIHKYSDIFFLDDHNGWILSTSDYLWKTTNAGEDWITINIPEIDTSGKITFVDEQNGWLISGNNLLHSNNGGLNWISQYEFPPFYGGYDIAFANDSIGFAYTDYRRLYKSVDGGESWNLVTDTLVHQYDISFYKDSIGYLCFTINTPYFPTETRYIYKTTDMGETWSSSYFELGGLQITVYYDKIRCVSEKECIIGAFDEWIFGGSYQLIKTTDSGATWNPLNINPSWPLDFEFISPQTGWSIGGSDIVKTTDGGMSWGTLQTFTNWEDRNTNFEFFDLNNSYLINLNHIYKTTNGWVTYAIVDSIITDVNENPNLPAEFILEQNFPNPFNPTTKIKFTIPQDEKRETRNVTLKVYDVLGNEVATLVNEEKSAGVYDFDFDGFGLSSGIYFYKLSAGNFTKTNKMILLK